MTTQEAHELFDRLNRAYFDADKEIFSARFVGCIQAVAESMLAEPTKMNAVEWEILLRNKLICLLDQDTATAPVSPSYDLANANTVNS